MNYSRLMGADEQATLATLNRYRDVFRAQVAHYLGRIVDTAGDSVLAVFDSVVEAVRCALAIQGELAQHNAVLATERQMLFRVGINLGDVIEQTDGTVYGDGVNVAARLESLAPPGGISISGTVKDFIEGKIPINLQFVGDHDVKNIDRPVAVYHVHSEHSDVTASAEASAAAGTPLPDKPSIAVLPFTNMSENADESYFADGISEDIITELSRFHEIVVVARNSTFEFKGQAINVKDVGENLNVRYILEGSVRRGGNQVRVTAQLVEAATGHHLWAERYDRRLEDVFAVQDELTAKIVASLVGTLFESERRRALLNDGTENLQAYELVLRGREYWRRFTEADNTEARRLYEQAIKIDPEFGRAYASLTWTYIAAYNEYWASEPQAALDKALEIALQGVRINPTSHSNRLVLGQVYFYLNQLSRAIDSLQKGIELNPNDPDGHVFLATALSHNGCAEQALKHLDHAFALTPNLRQWHRAVYIVAYFNSRRYNDAVAVWEKLDEPPTYFYRWIGASFAHLDKLDLAREIAEKYLESYPNFDLEEHLRRMPFRLAEDLAHYGEGLNLAGFNQYAASIAH